MLRLLRRLSALLCAIVFLVACAPNPAQSPLPAPKVFESRILPTEVAVEPTQSAPVEGTGSIVGRIVKQPGEWVGQEVRVYAAPFYSSENEGEGFFVLEPSIHPSALVDPKGSFQVVGVPPEKYVIVVGPSPEQAVALQEAGQTRIFPISADQVLDLGDLDLR